MSSHESNRHPDFSFFRPLFQALRAKLFHFAFYYIVTLLNIINTASLLSYSVNRNSGTGCHRFESIQVHRGWFPFNDSIGYYASLFYHSLAMAIGMNVSGGVRLSPGNSLPTIFSDSLTTSPPASMPVASYGASITLTE